MRLVALAELVLVVVLGLVVAAFAVVVPRVGDISGVVVLVLLVLVGIVVAAEGMA